MHAPSDDILWVHVEGQNGIYAKHIHILEAAKIWRKTKSLHSVYLKHKLAPYFISKYER